MISINTSYTNLLTQHTLTKNTNALQKATERLATGSKINHAVDDAAGVFLDVSLSSQISSMKTANDNTLLATNFLNIANGALTNVSDCLMRMSDIATQACSSVYSTEARETMQNEINALAAQMGQSIANAHMNGVQTLSIGVSSSSGSSGSSGTSGPAPTGGGSQNLGPVEGYVACTISNLNNENCTNFYISSAEQLQNLATAVNGGHDMAGRTFVLTNNIDLSSVCSASSGTSWNSIGTSSSKFQGTFDGNGYTISNLYIDTSGSSHGLFGWVENAELKNVNLSNVNVTAFSQAGALTGYAVNSEISSCFVASGTIKSKDLTSTSVGGIIGGLVGGSHGIISITNSYSAAAVSGGNSVGGIIGASLGSATITNCYSTGNVTGTATAGVSADTKSGGLIGSGNQVTISNSYTTGNVSGVTNVGALYGKAANATVTNSYATGNVNGVQAAEAANKASFNSSVLDSTRWNKSGTNPTLKAMSHSSVDINHDYDDAGPSPEPTGGDDDPTPASTIIRFQVGDTTDANSAIFYDTALNIPLGGFDVSTTLKANQTLSKIQSALERVTAKQSYIGTQSNRLENIYNSQQIRIENNMAAKSTISDADIAKEVANMTKAQILQQISVSMLTQTQSISGRIALSLL